MTPVDMLIPDLSDDVSREHQVDSIQTTEQRRKIYQTKIRNVLEGRGYRLKRFWMEKRKYYRSIDVIARRKRAEDIDLNCRYYNGDHYGVYDTFGNYKDQRQDGDFAYSVGLVHAHTEAAFVQLMKTRPRYTIDADDKGDPQMQQVAKFCEEAGTKELDRLMKKNRQTEFYNVLLGGESLRIIYWASDPKNPRKVQRLKHKGGGFALPAKRECSKCYAKVPDGEQSCPKCGNTEILESPAGESYTAAADGYEDILLGENCIHIPHPFSIQRDMSALTPEESTFLIERSYLDKHVAEYIYQSVIEPGTMGLSVEMQLRFDLERSSSQTDAVIGSARLASPGLGGSGFILGRGTGAAASISRKVEQEKQYLEPPEYGSFVCTVEEQLPNGKVIPAGTFLGEYFQKGVFILWCGDTLLDVDHCNRARKFPPPFRYGRIAGTNAGAGIVSKLRPGNDLINDDTNLNQAVKQTVGHPITVLGKGVDQIPGAGNLLKVTRAGFDDVRKAVAQFPGQAVNNSDGVAQHIERIMQFMAGTSTIGNNVGGSPDQQAASNTATGIRAMVEQQSDRQSGPVDSLVICDIETIIISIENIQEFSTPEQRADITKRIGPDLAALFFDRQRCNIRQMMTVSLAANTDLPRSMALHHSNQEQFGRIAQGLIKESGNQPWILEYLSVFSDSMGLPLSIGKGRVDRREGEYRLSLLNVIEPMIMVTEPNLDTPKAAKLMYEKLSRICGPLGVEQTGDDDLPRIFMQEHESFMDVYKDALFSERGKGWSDAHKLVVIRLWMDHYKMKAVTDDQAKKFQNEMVTAMDPDAAAEAAKGEKQRLLEALNLEFDDLPPDTQDWVLTTKFDAPPSQDLAAESAALRAGGESGAAEVAKAKAQMAVQGHKAALETEVAQKKADLQTATQAHDAGTRDSQANAEHQREMERQAAETERAAMEQTHEHVQGSLTRAHEQQSQAHEAEQAEKDRAEADRQRQSDERQAKMAAQAAKAKPKAK